ncbi:Cochlin [Liparis tanakae]|uniref:Cochlin n=1 Tax=Liparis tanakae TaxID=230148 RepID=A0A4Z2JCQ4_9TELE|nr:Cochlin [Liparis tanakae]
MLNPLRCGSVPYPVTCVIRGADLVEDGVLVLCPPDCTQVSVFGTEVYASVSSVCGAAVHRGILGQPGGSVMVHKLPGQHNYLKSYAHGIQSRDLSRWTASFSLTIKKPLKKPPVKKVSTGGNKEFLLSNYTQPKELLSAIKELVYLGGDTNTGKAIMHAVESSFTQENGGRRGYPRVMMVMIDGWPSDDLEQAALLARESGINVFLVSVAKAAPEELAMVQDKDFMKKAVCKDNGFFSYSMSSWFGTNKHVKPLAQKLCSLDSLLCSRTCYNSVNIGFLIDGSSSVGEGNFQLILNFLTGIAKSFDISDRGSHIGAVQFTYDQRLEFGFFEHSTKEASLNALKTIRYMSGGTATGAAITYTTENLFRRTGPGRNFLIVLTDGQSYDDFRLPAMAAQKQGITIYSVGVSWAPMVDLNAMASEPKENHIFFTREFTGLAELAPLVVRGICKDFTEKN